MHPDHAGDGLRLPPPPSASPAPEASTPAVTAAPTRRGPSLLTLVVLGLAVALIGGLVGSAATLLLPSQSQVAQSEPVVTEIEAPAEAEEAPAADEDDDQDTTPRLETGAAEDEVEADPDRVATVAAAVLPAVVMVEVDGAAGGAGNGSGVIYRTDGHIITNHHVIADAAQVRVVLSDSSRVDAEIVGSAPEQDLAVLKVEEVPDLTAIQIGESAQVRVGELAVAVGSPFGLDGSVTAGVVSSLNRQIPVTGPDGVGFVLQGVLQTDAPINPGNSGGPLVAGDATLIGVNSAILTRGGQAANAGVGFAIPANVVVEIADQLIEQGFVRQAFLGVAGITVNREIADRVGVDQGIVVEEVVEGTSAAEVGLQPGDVITALDGEPLIAMEELIADIFSRDVGEVLEITYSREGREETVEVTLGEKPPVGG